MDWLLAGRLVQGIGAAAGVSIARAMVRDLYTGKQSIRIMNMIGVLLAIGPAASPTLGGFALDLLGWRSVFVFMVAYGVILVAIAHFLYAGDDRPSGPVAGPAAAHPAQLRPAAVSPAFLGPSLVFGCTAGGLYTMATALPFVMIEVVGLSPTQFGVSMIMQSGSYLCGAVIMRQLLKRIDAHRLVPFGLACVGVAGAILAVWLRIDGPSFLGVMGPLALFAFGIAFISPSMQTSALAPFPDIAGSAAAMMGFFQMGGGFLGSAVAAWLGEPVVAVSTILPAMIAIAIAAYVISRSMVARRRMLDSIADRIIEPQAPAE